jgi:DNA-binding transcriptional regulator YdaS (Cro superfamily)
MKWLETLTVIFGSQEKIGKAAGVSQPAVSKWIDGVPYKRCAAVITAARAKGHELTIEQLRTK